MLYFHFSCEKLVVKRCTDVTGDLVSANFVFISKWELESFQASNFPVEKIHLNSSPNCDLYLESFFFFFLER